MNVKNIEKEGSKAKITLEIERDLMDAGANKAYLKARKEIQLPGFRKGKAPRKLIAAPVTILRCGSLPSMVSSTETRGFAAPVTRIA